ncbi:MAG: tetratricopeptide repeat protein [Candidatus Eisenbacteria bacterium]|nr:tetratricopeptide repeat protein [Candidatus Eisenbacteria bacterium]
MDKAIEIKRRAQRCIQNGDLDGALAEYGKLVTVEDSDPYNLVLFADLLFKKGDTADAGLRYLAAASAYEKAGLYKNAIAVCKKLMRLQLAPSQVIERLASLHALDGLGTEASLYFQQHADTLVQQEKYAEAEESLRRAYEASNENVKALERLADVQVLRGDRDEAVRTLLRSAMEYGRFGQLADAERCRRRALQLDPSQGDGDPGVDGPAPGRPEKSPPITDAVPGVEAGPTQSVTPIIEAIPSEPAAPVPDPAPSQAATTETESPGNPDIDPVEFPGADASEIEGPPRLEIESSGTARDGSGAEGGLARVADLVSSKPWGPAPLPRIDLDSVRVREDHDAVDSAHETPGVSESTLETAVDASSLSAPEDAVDDVRYERIELGSGAAAGPPALASRDAGEPWPIRSTRSSRASEPAPSTASESTFDAPGLRFEDSQPHPAVTLGDVERMLGLAQECFREGRREDASAALASAAHAYDLLGRLDNAATIYRSLGKSAHATREILELWIENCERRSDRTEAAQVACELGDHELNEGRASEARRWFERARDYDANNEVSLRRLQRMSGSRPQPRADATPPGTGSLNPQASIPGPEPRSPAGAPRTETLTTAAPAAPAVAGGIEPGRVEVAVGRGEAVTFDLGSLIAEFQRGVETQLSGDAQSHYDLAMSYREMGLLEQAEDSFRVVSADPAYQLRALEMIGRCLHDQGRFDEAILEFERAMSQDSLDSSARTSLCYEIGLTQQAAGRTLDALARFERVHAEMPGSTDAELKIRALRKILESP